MEHTTFIYAALAVIGVSMAVLIGFAVTMSVTTRKNKKTELTPEQNTVIDSAIRLRPYKIPKKVIEYYDEDAPYLVVAEKPNSTEVEYWWASDNDVKDLQNSRVADKYVQRFYNVVSEPVKGETNG